MAPGRLWKTPDTCTSRRGTRYDANPLACVSAPVAAWQYGLTGVTADIASPAPNALVPVVPVESSGMRARTSQLSVTVWPVLTPPDIVNRPDRTSTVASRPLKYCIHAPNRLAPVTRLFTRPAFSGTTS